MRYMKLLDKWFGFVFRKMWLPCLTGCSHVKLVWHCFKYVGRGLSMRMESFQTSLIFFLYVIWFSFLHPSPRVQVFPSLSFFRKHTPPGFASSTCRFWWAPCCRSSTLLPAVFSSSPPSWSAQDASPWHHLKATVPACFVFFLGTQNRTKKKTSIDLNSSNVAR